MLPASNACVLCLFSSCWMYELLVLMQCQRLLALIVYLCIYLFWCSRFKNLPKIGKLLIFLLLLVSFVWLNILIIVSHGFLWWNHVLFNLLTKSTRTTSITYKCGVI